MGAQDLMRAAANASGQSRLQPQKPKMGTAAAQPPTPEPEQEESNIREDIIETAQSQVAATRQTEQRVVRPRLPRQETSTAKHRFVKRPELPDDLYREVPSTSSYQIYNKDIDKFIKNFSSENSQYRGGAKITPSMLIEAVLDFTFYDMDIRPDGYIDLEELREHMRSKLK
ncbi:hypothetical protein TCA2_4412 [Paenibacillus sp. TCA20]|uniref:EF-hand domain-containing protein n=1 Tax=Paenibacillus urinalis TaxID=521520 RepID=A0ABY7XI15_9BACL|nr:MULTISPECIES: hypothetical protein [Paenibacillus]WDI05248.1 hypothetical protein PUW25_25910 [Paenibacillus urinalis]GAK41920.1 hypothetical protein TCA2_4412 [Paenibacillus sp. TCA20]